jgi:hypothetical protein
MSPQLSLNGSDSYQFTGSLDMDEGFGQWREAMRARMMVGGIGGKLMTEGLVKEMTRM